MKVLYLILPSIFFSLFTSVLFSQIEISKYVIANGVGTSSNDHNIIATTIGQPLIGIAADENTRANIGFWFLNQELFTDIRYIENKIEGFYLKQNFPNPFWNETKIEFTIPVTTRVHLRLLDHRGYIIQTLIKQELKPGTYECDLNGKDMPNGIYYYQFHAEGYKSTRKCIISK